MFPWLSEIAFTFLHISHRLPITELLKLVFQHYKDILYQFYKPLQYNICYFFEANQRYIYQDSVVFSSIWWRSFIPLWQIEVNKTALFFSFLFLNCKPDKSWEEGGQSLRSHQPDREEASHAGEIKAMRLGAAHRLLEMG